MGVYIDTIKKYSKAKIVLRAHNIEHFIWRRHIANEKISLKKLYLTLQNKRLKKFELEVISKVDAIVPITKTDEDEFKKLGFTKPIFTCITGVDVKELPGKIKSERKIKNDLLFWLNGLASKPGSCKLVPG